MARLAFDLDGVLADFNPSFADVLTELCGVPFPSDDPQWPSCWDWVTAAGVPKDVQQAAWLYIEQPACEFYYSLPSYPGVDAVLKHINALGPMHSVYFLTARPGETQKYWAEMWLQERGVELPTVMIVKHPHDKAMVVNALGIDAIIEDKVETVERLRDETGARVYLCDQPWNRGWREAPVDDRRTRDTVTRVGGVREMLQREGLL